MLRSLGIALALLLAAGPLGAQTASEEEYQAKLRELQQNMQALKHELQQVKGHRDQLQQELQQSEQAIGELQNKVQKLNGDIEREKKQLAQLRQRRAELRQKQAEQQQQIARHINAAYRLGRQSQLKMVLNQQQPDKVVRMIKYYDYFIDARAEQLQSYLALLTELAEVESTITTKTTLLSSSRESLNQQLAELDQRQQQRQQTLAALQRDITDKNQTLKQHEADRQRLERLLREVSQALANLSLPDGGESFRARQGKMSWPTRGKLAKRFGSSKEVGELTWEGVLINAAEGQPVEAIHHGRVVFADYLRGHGLLLIIDHGDDYLSLYAHNESLLKEPGDWVNRGETIARVGRTGGQAQAALYFEIRHRGNPINPAKWCRS